MKSTAARSVSWRCGVVLVLAVSGCGGGSEGSSTPVTPTPVATDTRCGVEQLVSCRSGRCEPDLSRASAGASLTPGWSLAAVAADAQGNYQFGDTANPPSTPYPVTVAAPGFLSHDLWITWQRGPRTQRHARPDSGRGSVLRRFLRAAGSRKIRSAGRAVARASVDDGAKVLREDRGSEWPAD